MNKPNKVILKITSIAVLFAGMISFVNPVVAETDIDFSAHIAPSFSVTIANGSAQLEGDDAGVNTSVSIDRLMPSSAGTLRYSDLTLGIYSNSNIGYIVTMTTDSSALVGEHGGEIIDTLDVKEDGYTIAEFTSNRWGYSIGRIENNEFTFGNYYPVLAGSNAIATGRGMANGDPLTVRLSAKLDYLAVPDTYTTTLNFNIIADVNDLIAADLEQ